MIRSLYSGGTGMVAQQMNVDVIANNLANVNTVGFKRSRADFQDLLYQTMRAPGVITPSGAQIPTGIQLGAGVKPAAVSKIFSQGDMRNSENELDIAIDGKGLFQIQRPDGELQYTRAGNFQIDYNGQIVTTEGFLLYPTITIPQDTTLISIDSEGNISVAQPGSTGLNNIGQIELANFVNPAGLLSEGRNLYKETEASGTPIIGTPDSNEFGSILQGFLEVSNVSVVEELTQMITAQRAYEVNSKTVQTADAMLQQATQLKR
ncbi:Flagellar basal-body rod protein FlgG [hydrothermal vent metagenome]|uniref:Flagellar basal-body rod protein FlgG n=1 Tax=hydrothermal vent metagenome TaxID=652676 RepID=A0A3B1BZX1_9ZZZZ